MITGFWKWLPRPFFALAPMANVTDAAFRRIIVNYGRPASPAGRPSTAGGPSSSAGRPDVMFTEFVSCDGLCSTGRERLISDLWFTEAERPIVAQFFGATPEHFTRCAELAQELGFDGIDINMGCPDRSVEKQGAGAALMKNPSLAQEIIRAAKRGAGSLPVSVKTRIGYAKNTLGDWLPRLFEAEPAAITIHARTRNEMSKVPAHWDAVRESVEIRDRIAGKDGPLIVGNGDAKDLADARKKAKETGADGIMLGPRFSGIRGCFRATKIGKKFPLKCAFVLCLNTRKRSKISTGMAQHGANIHGRALM